MNKYLSRITSSQRGQAFNPLVWPFLVSTFSYGVGFVAFYPTDVVSKSSLFVVMANLHPWIPFVWGSIAIITIIVGFTFLLFNIPPAGKVSGLVGFMLWVFAGICWAMDGGWITVFAVALTNMYFWIWQYLTLSRHRREDAVDVATIEAYNRGEYDDDNGGKAARENNRGVDRQ